MLYFLILAAQSHLNWVEYFSLFIEAYACVHHCYEARACQSAIRLSEKCTKNYFYTLINSSDRCNWLECLNMQLKSQNIPIICKSSGKIFQTYVVTRFFVRPFLRVRWNVNSKYRIVKAHKHYTTHSHYMLFHLVQLDQMLFRLQGFEWPDTSFVVEYIFLLISTWMSLDHNCWENAALTLFYRIPYKRHNIAMKGPCL